MDFFLQNICIPLHYWIFFETARFKQTAIEAIESLFTIGFLPVNQSPKTFFSKIKNKVQKVAETFYAKKYLCKQKKVVWMWLSTCYD